VTCSDRFGKRSDTRIVGNVKKMKERLKASITKLENRFFSTGSITRREIDGGIWPKVIAKSFHESKAQTLIRSRYKGDFIHLKLLNCF